MALTSSRIFSICLSALWLPVITIMTTIKGKMNMSSKWYINRDDRVPGSLRMVRIDDCDPVDGVLDVLGGDEDLWQ